MGLKGKTNLILIGGVGKYKGYHDTAFDRFERSVAIYLLLKNYSILKFIALPHIYIVYFLKIRLRLVSGFFNGELRVSRYTLSSLCPTTVI